MDKYECWNKHNELLKESDEKEERLESLIERWLSGEGTLSSDKINQSIININEKLAEMRNEAQEYKMEYERLLKEEQVQDEQLASDKAAAMRLRFQLGIDTNKMVITDGILSSNASESHLVGRDKTSEELEMDKQNAINILRKKVAKNEISLDQVAQLESDIENYYGKNNEETHQRHL